MKEHAGWCLLGLIKYLVCTKRCGVCLVAGSEVTHIQAVEFSVVHISKNINISNLDTGPSVKCLLHVDDPVLCSYVSRWGNKAYVISLQISGTVISL